MPTTHTQRLSMTVAFTLAIALFAAVPGSAAAKDPASSKDRPQDGHTQYDFEDDLVHADNLTPEGEPFYQHRNKKGDSLVRAREAFVVEMLKSIENL